MRPRRSVEDHPLGYQVSGESFVTADLVLAGAVAREYDRVDPLTCTHEYGDDLIEITMLSDPDRVYLRTCCGEKVTR